MRRILEREEYVEVPPAMYDDPFFRMTYLVKEEIRKYKWIEGKRAANCPGSRLERNGGMLTTKSSNSS
jgi:hypothetical protein